MAGTVYGATKTKKTLINKLGSEEGYSKFMADNGSKGGKRKVPKGFARSGVASEAGKKGGLARKKRFFIPQAMGGLEELVRLKEVEGKSWAELGRIFELNWWVVRARYLEYEQGVEEPVEKSTN